MKKYPKFYVPASPEQWANHILVRVDGPHGGVAYRFNGRKDKLSFAWLEKRKNFIEKGDILEIPPEEAALLI